VAHKLARLRDTNTDPKRFRELVREIAGLLAYEATADLATTPREVVTPMGTANGRD
jgi:uracil phosphoribosyltransferase